ncbi:serine--tRNA ligase [Thermodesulfovibrionales bacterium]|nr:serine--tRNA ligase [Thermodesulfovibrionales bacterium]MCL0074617.1 serine--tRNA ligase [Thermodesulfovibrionales bacterium]
MLNIQLLRQNPEIVQEALAKRNDDAPINEILRLDKEERNLLQRIEGLRARRNEVSRELERTKEKPPDLIADMRHVGELIRTLEQNEAQVSEQIRDMLLRMPNIPRLSVPHGKDGSDNVLVRSRGECRQFDFEPRPHWELGENLGIVDFERGVKLSGSRFYLLKGWGARMQRALINFMLDFHIKEHGYTEIYPPFMVRRECMVGSGNLPKFADNLYHDQEDDLWFVPTSEVPLTNLYRGEILPPGTLPIYHVAFTTCFRREKMSAGKDTRGIKRGHQFDKVELYKFVEPDTSDEELERMVEDAAAVCSKLGLPYRIVELCTADLGFASAKSYDIEVWAPGCGEWLEVSSCSNCTDFQSRRANVRYRPEPGAKPEFAHTLNGSGMALPRILISVLENYQQSNGSVAVPEALRTYMGVDAIT